MNYELRMMNDEYLWVFVVHSWWFLCISWLMSALAGVVETQNFASLRQRQVTKIVNPDTPKMQHTCRFVPKIIS